MENKLQNALSKYISTELIFHLLPISAALFYGVHLLTLKSNSNKGKNYIALLFFLFIQIEAFTIFAQYIKSRYV
ncbi:MAG: hypothetical protein SFU27_12065, partial [Thermonemataceae bacterium]|nr:hypothetical protein [Thermonemataceae bacterium]